MKSGDDDAVAESNNDENQNVDNKPRTEEIEMSAQNKPDSKSNGHSKEDEDNEDEFPKGSVAEQLLSDLSEEEIKKGLTTAEAERRQQEFGFNEVKEISDPEWIKYFSRFLGLVPLLIITTAILNVALEGDCFDDSRFEEGRFGNGDDDCECKKMRDWLSFGLLVFELFLVVTVDYLSDRSTTNAVKDLKRLSGPAANVRRDGKWESLPTRELVVGDVVDLVAGSIVPSDCKLLSGGSSLKIDESSLTGESLPVTKAAEQIALAGSAVVQGETEAVIISTGVDTFFGKTIQLLQSVTEQGNIQKVLRLVARMIVTVAFFFVLAIFIVRVSLGGNGGNAIREAFVLLVATLPIALPVVVTTGLAVGARELIQEKAIVQRLSAIEEMAGLEILCSDKTGTLTKNVLEISLEDSHVFSYDGKETSVEELLKISCLSARFQNQDAIDKAVTESYREIVGKETVSECFEGYKITDFIPFNPVDKRTQATIVDPNEKKFLASKGAPAVMQMLNGVPRNIQDEADHVIISRAERGLRVLGVATSDDEGQTWHLHGYISLLDPPRDDTKDTIENTQGLGLEVKMITGDQRAIAIETARRLGMGTTIYGRNIWNVGAQEESDLIARAGGLENLALEANGFAGVYPEHKFKIVEALQGAGRFIGMTGDGVNDAPALKKANVGIAVAGATDAAKSAADIVLTEPGLSTIVTAIKRARIIFKRLEAYIIYRLASSTLILGFFFFSIIILEFDFPTWVLVLLSLVNDFTVMATSKDNVRSSKAPLKWDMGRTVSIAVVIGLVRVGQSILFLVLALRREEDWWDNVWGLDSLRECEVVAVVYLDLAISIQLNIFSTRNKSFFFITSEKYDASPPPSFILLVPVTLSLIVASVVAAEWPGEDARLGSGAPLRGPGWAYVGVTWVYGIVWFFIVELVKVVFIIFYEADAPGDVILNLFRRKRVKKSQIMEANKKLMTSSRRLHGSARIADGLISSVRMEGITQGPTGEIQTQLEHMRQMLEEQDKRINWVVDMVKKMSMEQDEITES